MKRAILLSSLLIIAISLVSGFILSRKSTVMVNVHSKDLPKHGLKLILPSDESFEGRFSEEMKRQSMNNADLLRPFSIFLENQSQQTVVAYRIKWCFTKPDGETICTRQTVSSPRALMEGEDLTPDLEAQTGKVKPHSAKLLLMTSVTNTGQPQIGIPSTSDEAERMKQGIRPDPNELRQRALNKLAEFTDITVSIDGAFFEDGTFVGPDTTGFFAHIEAQIGANHDLLTELAARNIGSGKSKKQVFDYIESVAQQSAGSFNPKSTPDEIYQYYKKYYAQQILNIHKKLGDEEALAMALARTEKTWKKLLKREEGDK